MSTRRGFRVAEHHTNLLAKLVDEDAAAPCFADGSGELPQGLGHESSLQADRAVGHFPFNFRTGRQGGHRVDHNEVDGAGTDEVVCNFKGLLAVVRLRDQEVLGVHAQVLGVEFVEGVLGIDDGANAALLLAFGNGVDGQRGLS